MKALKVGKHMPFSEFLGEIKKTGKNTRLPPRKQLLELLAISVLKIIVLCYRDLHGLLVATSAYKY